MNFANNFDNLKTKFFCGLYLLENILMKSKRIPRNNILTFDFI